MKQSLVIITLAFLVGSCNMEQQGEELKDWEEIARELDVPPSDPAETEEDTIYHELKGDTTDLIPV